MTESAYPPVRNSSLAVISLVASIASWAIFPFIGAIIGVVLGHMALREIAESNGALLGDGMAKAGLVIGYAHLVIFLLGICFVFFLIALGFLPLLLVPFAEGSGVLLGLLV